MEYTTVQFFKDAGKQGIHQFLELRVKYIQIMRETGYSLCKGVSKPPEEQGSTL